MHNSGKLVILGILTVALIMAGASWWYRYAATHKAVQFWGPDSAELIRDAPRVLLLQNPPADISDLAQEDPIRAGFDESATDVSHAPGLLHLRNALLEDRSFDWPKSSDPVTQPVSDIGHWQLVFHDPRTNQNSALIRFSKDCRQAVKWEPAFMAKLDVAISTKPIIAAGLRQIFAEMRARPPKHLNGPSSTPPSR